MTDGHGKMEIHGILWCSAMLFSWGETERVVRFVFMGEGLKETPPRRPGLWGHECPLSVLLGNKLKGSEGGIPTQG
jgi:hypothetical protein